MSVINKDKRSVGESVLWGAVPSYMMLCRGVMWSAVLWNVVKSSGIKCCAMLAFWLIAIHNHFNNEKSVLCSAVERCAVR